MRIEYISENRDWGRLKDIASPGDVVCRGKIDMYLVTDRMDGGDVILINLATGRAQTASPKSEWQVIRETDRQGGYITITNKAVKKARSGDIVSYGDKKDIQYVRSDYIEEDGRIHLYDLTTGREELVPGDTEMDIHGDSYVKIWGPF